MQYAVVLSCLVLVAAADLLPEHHMTAQDMCSALPDLSFLGPSATAERKAKLLPHLVTVCEIYNRHYAPGSLSDVGKRDLLSGLGSLLGSNSHLSTLLKAADALSKAKGVFDEVKKIAPDVHQHFQDSIKDVHDGLQSLIDDIANEFAGKSTPMTPAY